MKVTDTDIIITKEDIEYALQKKTARLINIIMEEMNLSRGEAIKLWYNSKTKKETWDTDEYNFVSVSRCYDELEMELNNDPRWMLGSFE